MRDRITRCAGFVRKETLDVLNQPRLLATLVLGPFLVLALFGVGLSDELPRFSALFVAPEGSTVGRTIDRYADELASYIDYRGVMSDEEEAFRQLRRGAVDVVAVLPEDPFDAIRDNRRAQIEVYHDSLDPLISAAIEGAARLAADEINRQILSAIVAEGQSASQLLNNVLPPAQEGLGQVGDLLAAGQRADAEQRLEDLDDTLRDVADEVGDTLAILEGVGETGRRADALPSSEAFRQAIDRVTSDAGQVSISERLEQIGVVRDSLAQVRAELETLSGVRADVLIRPFYASTENVGSEVSSAFHYYVPSILMLLLQHLGVSFSALSLVRERQLGTMELFGVSPLSGGEILLGKCLSYLALGGVIALGLTAALRNMLDVPFAGSASAVAVATMLVLLASLGLGFLVSLVSRSDSQAVQLSMLTLLGSFFFSGFFLSIERLAQPANLVASVLPATHGISIAREVMLRGRDLPPGDVLQLVAVAAVSLAFVWRRFGGQLRSG